ncbi:hypothetical protein MAHJHV55_52850 [Mycobacterium avium subsp. hominissuis]
MPARRARRAGKIPAVLYGHGTDPQHLELPGHDFAAVSWLSACLAIVSLLCAVALCSGHGQDATVVGLRR